MNANPVTDVKLSIRVGTHRPKKLTSGVLDVRDHRQICMQERDQGPIRLRQPGVAGETKLRVALDICERGDLLALAELRIQPFDTLRSAVRQVRPHLVAHRCGNALLEQLTNLLILPRIRRRRRCHYRDPLELTCTVCLDSAHVRCRCGWHRG